MELFVILQRLVLKPIFFEQFLKNLFNSLAINFEKKLFVAKDHLEISKYIKQWITLPF